MASDGDCEEMEQDIIEGSDGEGNSSSSSDEESDNDEIQEKQAEELEAKVTWLK